MSEEEEKSEKRIDRRTLLAFAGTSAVAGIGGSHYLFGNPGDTPDDSEQSSYTTETTDTPESDVVSIARHGAIEGRDTRSAAIRNREAIRNAAHAAGENGTVRIPEGDYYFGDSAFNNQFHFGERVPKGVSFEGLGPTQSKLIFTSTIDPNNGYRAFTYEGEDSGGDTLDHGSVTIRNLCLDGNYENLDLDEGHTVWGLRVEGDGDFTLKNVWIRGWWANGTMFTGPSVHIGHCRFEENAIGVAQTNGERTAGHHIAARPSTGNTMLIEDCEFLRCSGTVINRAYNSGEVILRRAWIRGVGYGCFKLSRTAGTTRAENVYFEPHTAWMSQNLPQDFEMDGRWFLYRIYGNEFTPTVVLNNVIAKNLSRGFILCYQDTDIVLKGDMIAVHNASMSDTRGPAIRADSGIDFDIGTMSVHDTGGAVFDAPGSTGIVENLFRDGNEGIGLVGDVSIGDRPNSDPIRPKAVRRYETGISSYVP